MVHAFYTNLLNSIETFLIFPHICSHINNPESFSQYSVYNAFDTLLLTVFKQSMYSMSTSWFNNFAISNGKYVKITTGLYN